MCVNFKCETTSFQRTHLSQENVLRGKSDTNSVSKFVWLQKLKQNTDLSPWSSQMLFLTPFLSFDSSRGIFESNTFPVTFTSDRNFSIDHGP